MMKLKYLLLFLWMMIPLLTVWAQDKPKEVKDRTANKAENRLDNKIDNGIDKGLDAFEGLFKKKKKKEQQDSPKDVPTNSQHEEATANPFSFLGGGKTDVNLSAQYNFSSDLTYKVVMINKKGKKRNEMNMQYLLSNNGEYLGMRYISAEDLPKQTQNATMVMEGDNMISFIDTEDNKMAMVMSLNSDRVDHLEEEISQRQVGVKKTGRSRTILGYTCEEYVAEDVEGVTSTWIAPELANLGQDLTNIFGMMAQNKKTAKVNPNIGQMEGMMLAMDYRDKKDDSTVQMEMTELNLNSPSNFSTEGYQVMSMNLFGNGK